MRLLRPLYMELKNRRDIDFAHAMAVIEQIGKKSTVHADPGRRKKDLAQDQRTGQFGRLANANWLHGLYGAANDYRISSSEIAVRPGGTHLSTFLGSNIICHTTYIDTVHPLYAYRLLATPFELQQGGVFVLQLVPPRLDPPHPPGIVMFMGWATPDMFPDKPDPSGEFKGKRWLQVPDLMPCQPFAWADPNLVEVAREAILQTSILQARRTRPPGRPIGVIAATARATEIVTVAAKPCSDDLLQAIEDKAGIPTNKRWASKVAQGNDPSCVKCTSGDWHFTCPWQRTI